MDKLFYNVMIICIYVVIFIIGETITGGDGSGLSQYLALVILLEVLGIKSKESKDGD